MDIKNVLVPTDFSEPSQIALDYGIALARQLRARLTVLHVLEPQAAMDVTSASDIVRIERERQENALQQLEGLLAPEDEDDLDFKVVLKFGSPRRQIAATVEEEHVDLVVLGTHGRRRLERFILGSTTEALLRKLHVPVLTVSHVAAPKAIERILFATDLAEPSGASFDFALDAARTLRANLVAMHAMGGPVMTSGELGMTVQTEDLAAGEAHRRLDLLVAKGRQQGITVQTSIDDGPAAEGILKAAAECSADLILLPIETRSFLDRTLFGTTAEHVVRDAGIPVLTVPVRVETRADHERRVV
jgi:nucleotide-binding universal stress UspA family protein